MKTIPNLGFSYHMGVVGYYTQHRIIFIFYRLYLIGVEKFLVMENNVTGIFSEH